MKWIGKSILFYLIFLIPSTLLFGLIFTEVVAKLLWYEWDSLPLIDLFTFPSVHTEAGAHFIAPTVVVYTIWSLFLVLTFIMPVIFARAKIRKLKIK
jgi:hypothetical protein